MYPMLKFLEPKRRTEEVVKVINRNHLKNENRFKKIIRKTRFRKDLKDSSANWMDYRKEISKKISLAERLVICWMSPFSMEGFYLGSLEE